MTLYQYAMFAWDMFPKGLPPGYMGLFAREGVAAAQRIGYEAKRVKKRKAARRNIPTFAERIRSQCPNVRLHISGDCYYGSSRAALG